MSDPFIGEIIAVAFNYGNGFNTGGTWLPCNGQALPISRYAPLFSLIGTYYGGDGISTFNLPNLNGVQPDPAPRVIIGQGQGPGLSNRVIGEQVGAMTETLAIAEMPLHNHGLQLGQGATSATPGPSAQSVAIDPLFNGFVGGAANTQFALNAIAYDGGGQPHPNNQPTTGLWYCIAVTGIFPSFG